MVNGNPVVGPRPSKWSIRLHVIEAAWPTAKVVEAKGKGPLFEGSAEADYTCGTCNAVFCSGIGAGELAGFVFRCWCGALNMVPAL
jgi:hypothetical protein